MTLRRASREPNPRAVAARLECDPDYVRRAGRMGLFQTNVVVEVVQGMNCPYCGQLGFMQFDNGPLECSHCGRPWFSKGMHDEIPQDGVTKLQIWPGLPDKH
jgi:ribosomal protein L37AE/L43A